MVPQKTTGLKNDNCLFSPQAFKAVIYIPSALFAQMLALQIPCVKRYVHYLTSRADRNSNTTSFSLITMHYINEVYNSADCLAYNGCFIVCPFLNWANDCFTKADE